MYWLYGNQFWSRTGGSQAAAHWQEFPTVVPGSFGIRIISWQKNSLGLRKKNRGSQSRIAAWGKGSIGTRSYCARRTQGGVIDRHQLIGTAPSIELRRRLRRHGKNSPETML